MKTILFCILVGAAIVASEVIDNTPCNNGPDANVLGISHEISVEPCPEAEQGEPCVVHKGSDVTIKMRFTPYSSPSRVKSTMAIVNGDSEMIIREMSPDACAYMECPMKTGEENTFSATFPVGTGHPNGLHQIKFKIQELRGPKRVFACQTFAMKFVDPQE